MKSPHLRDLYPQSIPTSPVKVRKLKVNLHNSSNFKHKSRVSEVGSIGQHKVKFERFLYDYEGRISILDFQRALPLPFENNIC